MLRFKLLVMAAVLVIPGPLGAQATTTSGSAQMWPLRFVLDRPLEAGGETRVRLRNVGDVTYMYNEIYEACEMTFRKRSGRRFIVPEGTHCDLIVHREIAPGETVTLFEWDLDECTEDNWGCTKEKDLPPGRYVMKGSFRPKGGGDPVRAVRAFRIRPR